jgi:hypothetical protein
MNNQRELATWLIEFVCSQLQQIESRYFPQLKLPALFAGHPMGADVKGDLVFVLGLLHELGITEISGLQIPGRISAVLKEIDGNQTHSFYSYRVAETLLRFGQFADNTLLEDFDAEERLNIATACDSTSLIDSLGSSLPKNYVAVLTRCENARKALGIEVCDSQLEKLLEGTKSLMSDDSLGFIDDSNTGDGRYDIYSADIYLFTEPFASSLGSIWPRGFHNVLDLVDHTLTSDGTGIPWGRSTGVLGLCITIELAGMALGRNLTTRPSTWLRRAMDASLHLENWFFEGLITAHQYRSTFAYRGPFRRIQMTFDILGKLLQTAIELVKVDEAITPDAESVVSQQDVLLPMSEVNNAAVWSYRSEEQRFVLPLVGSAGSDYLPVPRNPGLLEYPVDSDLATGVPVVLQNGQRYIPAMLPDEVVKQEGGLFLKWNKLTPLSRRLEGDQQPLHATSECQYRVDGASITMNQTISFDSAPEGITIQFTEMKQRPLKVEFHSDSPHQCSQVSVAGIKEYRSFWNELSTVHQMDVCIDKEQFSGEVRLSACVTPKLRICNTIGDHHYQRALYDPIQDDVVDMLFPRRCWQNLDAASKFLKDVDQFHLHWPEHFLGTRFEAHNEMIRCIKDSGARIIWTQHNLLPHRLDQRDNSQEIYQAWAQAADAVVHHSESGKRRVMDRYQFNPMAMHRTIMHGHFGNLMTEGNTNDRSEVEDALGMKPCDLRIGIVGAPRIEKNVQLFMNAFAASTRKDLQLLVTSLSGDEIVPEDDRITAIEYDMVDREIYNKRLGAIDVLAFPIVPGDLLTTGVVGDAIGHGIPGLVSNWDFLEESLQGAGIPMGDSQQEMTAAINALDQQQVRSAALAAVALQQPYDWATLSKQFLQMLRELGTSRL